MLRYLLVISLTCNLAFASGTAKLADYLLNGAGLVEVLARYGIKGEDAQAVKSYVTSAMKALEEKGSVISKADFTSIISGLPVSGEDAKIRKELQMLLAKTDGSFNKDDVVKAINHIIYLSNRHGKSVIITCAECVNESLAKNGFKFTVETLKDAKSVDMLAHVIPNSPAELNTFITTRMRRLNLGDYSKVTPALVSPTDEKSLALFVALAENGTKEQKDFINAIKNISKSSDGKVNIIDPKNPHKFWRELSEDMSPETMKGWTDTLNEVAAKRAKEGGTAEEAFYNVLKEKADKDPALQKQYEQLKAKRCFFK
jgi:predicted Zn-ribbon and HTH transcriptional regulator